MATSNQRLLATDITTSQIRIRENNYSCALNVNRYDTLGFAADFPLRKHKSEEIATIGTNALRQDWRALVGPITKFGSHNPRNGHCCALLFPFCKPERLWLIAYIIEFVFLYDHVLETAEENALGHAGNDLLVERSRHLSQAAIDGTVKIRTKMLDMLAQIDSPGAQAVERAWLQMVQATAQHDKRKLFRSLDEYIAYRVIDAGAPFCMALMCWGMGIQLTIEEQSAIQPCVDLAYAAIALANDVVSFEEEYADFKKLGAETLTNAVWLHLQLNRCSLEDAKKAVTHLTVEYENAYRAASDGLRSQHKLSTLNVNRYLDGLTHQIAGDVVWSLNCPRYHRGMRTGLGGYVDSVKDGPAIVLKSKQQTKAIDASQNPENVRFLVARGWSEEVAIDALKRSGASVIDIVVVEERDGLEAAWKLVKAKDKS